MTPIVPTGRHLHDVFQDVCLDSFYLRRVCPIAHLLLKGQWVDVSDETGRVVSGCGIAFVRVLL